MWVILVQPLLFGAIGAEVNFHNISGSVIVKTIIILALGAHPTIEVYTLEGYTFKPRDQVPGARGWGLGLGSSLDPRPACMGCMRSAA